ISRERLTRPPVAPTVVRDDAEALLREEEHLAVPSVRAQRPAVRERHHWAFAPVLVVDQRPVFRSYRAHARLLGSGQRRLTAVSALRSPMAQSGAVLLRPRLRTVRRRSRQARYLPTWGRSVALAGKNDGGCPVAGSHSNLLPGPSPRGRAARTTVP